MTNDVNILWADCQQILRDNLSQSAYQTWFAPIVALQWENDLLVLQVKSQFVVDYIEDNYLDLLSRVLRKVFGAKVQLEYRILMAGGSIDIPSDSAKQTTVRRTLESSNPTVVEEWESQLNLQYTFDNFVKGEPNKLARAAGVEIAKQPGKTIFNPLFLFGGSGVGKTHLANAIGNYVAQHFDNARVLYVTANTFKLQFQDAVNHNRVPDFLMFYQSVDVLIVDDIQYFSDLKGTQDTFFQIFNYLQQSHKQLILTSDRSPMELRGVQERLLSRFKWGLAAEITRPDYQLRKDILAFHIKKNGIKLSDEIIDYIANNVTDNVRDLEGVLASLLAYSTLTDSAIDMALTQKVVGRLVELNPRTYVPSDIITAVCQHLNIPEKAISARTRQRDAVRARSIVMYLIKKYTESSLAEIGAYVHRDHATVAYSLNAITNHMSYDAVLRQDVAMIERALGR
ncbi:MAG: chromosomal replication initiator protein DnaA [Paludibacteraceae bacterium]|nr:chromosomal replication initiator protein DnaA [Paludibacteraceae bacterium]